MEGPTEGPGPAGPAQEPPIVIVGAGGHGKVVASALLASGVSAAGLEVLDDDETTWGTSLLGVRVAGPVGRLAGTVRRRAVLGVGDNAVRKRLAGTLQADWVTVVHPRTWVDPSVHLGPGAVICAGAILQPDAVVGAHTIVNTGACVDHDCRIGDFVHLGPGVHLAGGVSVKEGATIGAGSSIVPGVSVGAWAVIGAGAAVVRDVPDGVTAVGVPARPVGRD